MPDENDGEEIPAKPDGEPLRMPPQPASPNAQQDESSTEKLEKDIKRGEWWLIRIGIATFAMNSFIAFVYWQQLTQMRVATDASSRSTEIAAEALQTSTLQTDRMMVQTVDQTVAQYKSEEATVKAANAAKSAADTARDALVSAQRAFIFATGLDAIRIQNPREPAKIGSMDFSITWENSGTTPTREMSTHYSWLTPRISLPNDFPFPDLGDPRPTPIALGPKAIGHTPPISIPAEDVARIMDHQEILYIWGWARYRDIFPRTKPHITRFCSEGYRLSGKPTDRRS